VLGLTVDLLVGDLDSIDPADLRDAETRGTKINRHPVDKDATDLDLALQAARDTGARTVTVISGGGGRLDHLVGGIALLGSAAHADLVLDAWIGPAHITVVHGPATACIVGRPNEMVTVLAIGGPAAGIVTEGLRFALGGETLRPGESRGLSNELIGKRARLLLETGTVLIIRPDALNDTKEPR
jgi:thiamine pyrophosphokinase